MKTIHMGILSSNLQRFRGSRIKELSTGNWILDKFRRDQGGLPSSPELYHREKKYRNGLTSNGALRIFRVGVLIVTNSSAAVGWTPTVASKSALVRPAFKATANPWNPH